MDNPHYVTPEEAKKKLCHMGMSYDGIVYCDGPSCMAWRWGTSYKWDEDADRPEVTYSATHGYCGMVRNQ